MNHHDDRNMLAIYHNLHGFISQFLTVSDEDFLQLKNRTVLKYFHRKEKITVPGDIERCLYFTGKGLIREYFYKGKLEVTTDIIPEGTITGSVSSFLTGQPSHYCLEAIETVTALAISKYDLEQLYLSDRKWERFGRIVTSHFVMQQEQQILDGIRYTVRERFLDFIERSPELLQRVPQKHLASYLNIKPETFSRLKHLVKQNKVTRNLSS
jgi:CRP-like cAMP-binding protein